MLPGAPPFSEVESVIKLRTLASKLTGSGLPILFEGEVGTGRRTLAGAIAASRAQGKQEVLTFSVVGGVPEGLRDVGRQSVVVVHHLHALDPRGQAEVATLVRDRQVAFAGTARSREAPLAPELAALTEATRLVLPPLRERAEDVVKWAQLFLERAVADLGGKAPTLSADARRAVAAHAWPGNLSELESVIRRAVVLRQEDVIDRVDLGFEDPLVVQPLTDAVEDFRMSYVRKVLAHFDDNRTQAARALGIDPRTIFRYLAKAKDEDT